MTQFSAVYTLNRVTMLPVFKEWYPWCTGVFLIVEAGDGPTQRPPTTLRRRSRGRHSPGDGNYFCAHVTTPHGINGFRYGDGLYLTELPRTEFTYRKESTWLDFDGSSFNVEWCDNVHNYYYEQYTLRGFTKVGSYYKCNYSESKWSAYSRIPADYDTLSSMAFAREPFRQEQSLGSPYQGPTVPLLQPVFEERYLAQSVDNDVVPNLGAYLNDAYIEAFNSLPSIETNNIANLFAIFGGLKSLIDPSGLVYEGIGSLKDAWMGYRYQYSTTKADIQEIAQYAERMRTFKNLKAVTGHGVSYVTLDGIEYTFKCALQTSADDYLGIYNTVEKFGLALDGYNAWDMIPYSFVVDWFLHIGDLLESGRSRRYAMRLQPSAAWFSITRSFTNRFGCDQNEYYRFTKRVDLAQLPASMLRQASSRNTTWVKRGADAVCLFS